MALPPTALKALLYECGSDAERVSDALVAAGCTRGTSTADRTDVQDLVREAQERLRRAGDGVGPNLVDILSDLLVASGQLSSRGKKLAATLSIPPGTPPQ